MWTCYLKFRNAESSGTHASQLLSWSMGKTMEAKRIDGNDYLSLSAAGKKNPFTTSSHRRCAEPATLLFGTSIWIRP